jgi:hypothetical protein
MPLTEGNAWNAPTGQAHSMPGIALSPSTKRSVEARSGRPPGYGSSERMAKVTLAGRSASRRMYHGYQNSPYAMSVDTR